MTETPSVPAASLKKYRQAAWGFFILNLLYLVLVYVFLPPFNIGLWAALGYTVLALALFGTLSYFIYKGKKTLVVVLAALWAARALLSTYTLITGEAFAAVPYVLPTTLLSFYLLGRALWDWP